VQNNAESANIGAGIIMQGEPAHFGHAFVMLRMAGELYRIPQGRPAREHQSLRCMKAYDVCSTTLAPTNWLSAFLQAYRTGASNMSRTISYG